MKDFPVTKSDEEWKDQLTADQYEVTREGGTEPAGSGELYENTDEGVYRCVCCDAVLFDSEAKYKSGTGWPSFWRPHEEDVLVERPDHKLAQERTEVVCSQCGAHLGHVFEDGPEPTGLRYCINSVALTFDPAED